MSNTTDPITRVALYVRVSTDEQVREGYSIEAQKASLLAYAKGHGYRVIDTYVDEGYTARKKFNKRKEFVRLLNDAKDSEFDLILFIKLDRWFRSVSDYYKIQEVLEASDVNWKTTLEDYDTSTAGGRLNLNIRLSVNQDESDRTSERIEFVFDKKVADGEAISGSQPVGYMVKDKKVVPDPEKEAIARDVFDTYEMLHSRIAVIRHIRAKYGYSLHYNSVAGMLSNTLYYGSYRGNHAYCEPLISKDQFDRIQRILKKNYVRGTPSGRIYIFSSLLRCSDCGRTLSGLFTKKKSGKEYYYYRCGGGISNADCTNRKQVREDRLEEYLLNNVAQELENLKVEYDLKQAIQSKPIGDKRKIQRQLERLKELYVKEFIDLKSYTVDFEIYKAQLEALEKSNVETKVDFERLKGILDSNFQEMYNSLDKKGRRTLWLNMLERIVISKGEVLSIFFE